jgi:hypothetical protein
MTATLQREHCNGNPPASAIIVGLFYPPRPMMANLFHVD